MAEQLLPVLRTAVTMPDYVRAVVRAWPLVGEGIPLEQSIGVLWAQYMIETGGRACWNWNVGNAKHVKGDGHDYQMLGGVWEGVAPTVAERLVSSGQAVFDANPDHIKAIDRKLVAVVFQPPHATTWFRAFASLDEGMAEHLKLLAKRFSRSWPAVLDGDVGEFAALLKAQGYFTASAEAYAAGMRGPFAALVASSTYEELVTSPAVEPEAQAEEVSEGEAVAWDRNGEIARLASEMHRGATGLIIEDLLAARDASL